MGQAPRPALPYWLAASVQPESGTWVPIHCLHLSPAPPPQHPPPHSPYLPSPAGLPLSSRHCHPRGQEGLLSPESSGRLELLKSTLVIARERELKEIGGKGRRGEERTVRGGKRSEARERERETPADPEPEGGRREGKESWSRSAAAVVAAGGRLCCPPERGAHRSLSRAAAPRRSLPPPLRSGTPAGRTRSS